MAAFTLQDLQTISRKVISDSSIILRADARAEDVPGWDSLSHTLIIMDVNDRLGIDLAPDRAATARNFGGLLDMIHSLAASRGGLPQTK